MSNTRITVSQPGQLKLWLKNHDNPRIQVICVDEGLYWKGHKVSRPNDMTHVWPKTEWRIDGEWK